MKDHEFYNYDKFIADDTFRKWVLSPDQESDHYWEEWLANNSDKKELALQARAIMLNIKEGEENLSEHKKKDMWSAIEKAAEKMDREKATFKQSKALPINPRYEKPQKKTRNTYYLIKVAAAISILIVSAWIIFSLSQNKDVKSSLYIATTVKLNPAGQRTILYLPDGSTVVLAADSKLSYHEGFQGDFREVWLEGEAFFKVAKNPDRPFKVHSGEITTTALGTSFNVNAHKGRENIAVSLVTGKVLVASEEEAKGLRVYLTPGQQALYHKNKKMIYTKTFNITSVTGWKDGKLIFDEATHDEVFKRLGRWYGVQITFKNKPSHSWNYTGEFSTESLENVLKGLSFIHGFDFEISGETVTINYDNKKESNHGT